jgi:hypothetical protein
MYHATVCFSLEPDRHFPGHSSRLWLLHKRLLLSLKPLLTFTGVTFLYRNPLKKLLNIIFWIFDILVLIKLKGEMDYLKATNRTAAYLSLPKSDNHWYW